MNLRRTVAVACVGALALLGQELAAVASPSPRLVLRYTFEQDTTVAVHDSSASGLTGVLVNADPATAFIDGVPGRKRVLQLVASKRQYVDVPQSNTIDVDQYTLAAWIRYTGVSTPDTHDRWEVIEKAGAYWMNVRTNGRLRAGGFYGGVRPASTGRSSTATRPSRQMCGLTWPRPTTAPSSPCTSTENALGPYR